MSSPSNTAVLMAIVALLFTAVSVAIVWDDLTADPPPVEFVAPFHYDAGRQSDDDRGLLEDEYLTLLNQTENPVDLSGWIVRSDGGRTYVIPDGFVLPAGETLTLITGCGEDDERTLHWCAISEIWDNESGTAYLSMPDGTRITTHHYQSLCKTCHSNDDE